MKTLRNESEKATINQVHLAFIYGVNLKQVPLLEVKFKGMKKNFKEDKLKNKKLRKTLKYFKRIDKANQSLLIPLPQF